MNAYYDHYMYMYKWHNMCALEYLQLVKSCLMYVYWVCALLGWFSDKEGVLLTQHEQSIHVHEGHFSVEVLHWCTVYKIYTCSYMYA